MAQRLLCTGSASRALIAPLPQIFNDDIRHDGKPIDWGQWAITCDDPAFKGKGNPVRLFAVYSSARLPLILPLPSARQDTGDDYEAAPDLDHLNPDLRQALKDWMAWLVWDVGFEGWRLDFARGYAGTFVKEYADASVGDKNFIVGEFWADLRWSGSFLEYNQDEARKRLIDWVKSTHEYSAAFDFPTKGLLQEAFKNSQFDRLRAHDGKPPGLLGSWPGKAVTFIDNHDTGSTQQHWPFPGSMVEAGYAYILTHPGIPCIFIEHMFDWKGLRDKVAALIRLRKAHGVNAESKITIRCADRDLYVAEVEGTTGLLTLKLGPRWDMGQYLPQASAGWSLAASGDGYAVWAKPKPI